MQCQISKKTPEVPATTKYGHLYELSLITKFVQQNGKCPITGEDLSEDDIIPLKLGASPKPRAVTGSSIPGMLQSFQNEWDAVMLETFTLRKQLDTTRQELAKALYQHDAACRVIARLTRERDEARQTLSTTTASSASGAPMDVDREITPEIKQRITAINQQLTAARKKRQVNPMPQDSVKALKSLGSFPIHKASEPGILCVDNHPESNNLYVTGGVDKTAVIFDHATEKKVATLEGHTKKVGRVLFHCDQDVVFTASHDKTARIWSKTASGYQTAHKIAVHTSAVTDLDLHPLKDYIATSSSDGTWSFHDIRTGVSLARLEAANGCASLRFHPDGLYVGIGTSDNKIAMYDLKSQAKVATFQGHSGTVGALAFSENGFYMASGSEDGTARIWDLRNTKNLSTHSFGEGAVRSLDIDYSGMYVAAATADVSIFVTKTLELVKSLSDHSQQVTGVKWNRKLNKLASTSMDRSLRIYGL